METQSTTTLFDDIGQLATRMLPGSTEFGTLLQRRRKDLDALVALGVITGNGTQAALSAHVQTLRTLGEDLRGLLSESGRRSDAVRDAARNAVAGFAELAEVVVGAQTQAFDTVKERAVANVEELKALTQRAS